VPSPLPLRISHTAGVPTHPAPAAGTLARLRLHFGREDAASHTGGAGGERNGEKVAYKSMRLVWEEPVGCVCSFSRGVFPASSLMGTPSAPSIVG
jgi:hypothetical protein